MLVSVVETPAYLASAATFLSEAERDAIVDTLAANPTAGVIVPGSGGLRKMRIPVEGRGKRGGGRVIYWFHTERKPLVLLYAFAKNVADDLTAKQLKMFSDMARDLADDFGA